MSVFKLFTYRPQSLHIALILFVSGLFIPAYYKILPLADTPETIQKHYTKAVDILKKAERKILFETDTLASDNLFAEINNITEGFKRYGIEFFVTENSKIRVWTTNELPVSVPLLKSDRKILHTSDGSLIRKTVYRCGDKWLIGLLVIKKGYPIKNDYLRDKPNLYLLGSSQYQIANHGIPIKDPDGSTAFYVRPVTQGIPSHTVLVSLLFLFGALVIVARYVTTHRSVVWTSIVAVSILLLYFLSLWWCSRISLPVWQPYIYSSGSAFPNIFSALVFSLAMLFASYMIPSTISGKVRFVFTIAGYPLLFVFTFRFLESLIIDSTVNFRIHEITSWTLYTAIMAMIFSLTIAAVSRFAVSTFPTFENKFHYASVLFSVPVLYGLLLVSHYTSADNMFAVLIYLILLALLFFYKTTGNSAKLIPGLLGLAIVITLFVTYFSNQKEKNIKELLVTKLVEERDFVAETLAREITARIERDTALQAILNDTADVPDINQNVSVFLRKNYFSGYWNNYDIQVTCCTPDCNLEILGENKTENCYKYFSTLASDLGASVVKDKVFFLNNNNGRISYLFILMPGRQKGWKIFVEADSKLVSIRQGYPELMLSYGIKKNNLLSEFSYAKYKNGRLYSQYGSFAYPLSAQVFAHAANMVEVSFGGYEHLVYFAGNNTLFVLSNREKGFWDFLQSLSYIFIITVLSFFVFGFTGKGMPGFKTSLRFRIQYTIFALLTLFFLITAIILIYTTKNNFDKYHRHNLEEKMESIMSELTEKGIPDSYDKTGLTKFLNQLSEIFYTDIHLYDTSGTLLATSIPVIFDKYIQAPLINPKAYYYLNKIQTSRYIHKEHIGRMSFLSAYTPLLNRYNIPSMYVNLPYFTKQTEMTKQVATTITSIVNIFVFLITLSFIFTVIIAEKITVPLTIIRKHLQEVRLGNKNKKITLDMGTELGDLVREYNKMIDKLEESAEILARTERESAWREMARQVAHDIKNPLTPMKLSIQYLQQTWEDHKDKDLKEFIDKIAKTIIEQIDTITFIANEFSNFAKTPDIKLEPVQVQEHLANLITLYENHENFQIVFSSQLPSDTAVCFDRHYFNRVIGNIIKNAVQSIPRERKGEIKIDVVETEQERVLISIGDNGVGIPNEIRDKIFSPNFTTKASGMGLGLAIAKNLIDFAGGSIYFETSSKGTTFYVEFKKCVSFYGD